MSEPAVKIMKSEKTRDLILSSAEDLFKSNGYHGTSMRQIAKNAHGIAVGGIYNHFESKEDIFCELLNTRTPWKKIISIFEEADGETSPIMLEDTFLALQKLLIEHQAFTVLLLLDIRELDGKTTRRLAEKVYPSFIAFVAKVNDKGGLREDISIMTALRSFTGMLIGTLMTTFLGEVLLGSELEYAVPDLEKTLYDSSDMIDAMFYGIVQSDDDNKKA